LLNRKREALISELFRSARPALDARKQVEDGANQAYAVLLHALAARGQAALQTYAWPKREIIVELEERRIWGIPVPTVVSHSRIRRTLGGRDTTAAAVGPAAARTAAEFEQLVELVLESLPKEQLVRRLGVALGKTTRQVNTLQLRVEPVLTAELHALRGMLEERERDERSRLRHVLRRMKASSITVSGGHQRA
jgi:V/A-type H+-transporting ATPase subunit D